MNKFISSMKYIKLKDILAVFVFISMLIPSIICRIIFKIKGKKLWLICEDGKNARDNGYYFYKYLCKVNPKNIAYYYVIDKNSYDYNKLKNEKNIIQFKSILHWILYMSADYNISNHKNGNPNQPLFYFIHIYLRLFNNRVFLQHGITKDNAEWLYYKNTRFKYFVCGAKREYEYIKENFGYPEKNLIYTGFPRFDTLHEFKVKNNQILIMPTWRNWLGRETNRFGEKFEFVKTNYYKCWNGILNNRKLIDWLEKNNYYILFYPHINMQKFIDKFEVNTKNIQILKAKDADIQELLKESSLLITDYSSVYMDFAYMKKSTIYYQFDYDEYRNKQYQDGYFNYLKDGFGPVCNDEDTVVKNIISFYQDGCQTKYIDRMNKFFELYDENNCERIFKILEGYCYEKK